jgi:hypothetical protein
MNKHVCYSKGRLFYLVHCGANNLLVCHSERSEESLERPI